MRVIDYLSAFLCVTSAVSTAAFVVNNNNHNNIIHSRSIATTKLQVAAELDDLPLVLTGNNIDLTPAISEYVTKRIGSPLRKLASGGAILECDVHLSVNKNPKVKDAHRVEITTNLKGTTIHSKHESPDMYASIDAVAKSLSRKLRKYKERRMDGWHGGAHMSEDIMKAIEQIELQEEAEETAAAAAAAEEYVDPEAPSITKVKSFNLEKPISIQEAIFALDYIDHDFYVFKNEETDQVNIVYKRHFEGGVGLIEVN